MGNILVFLQQSGEALPKGSLAAAAAAVELQSRWQCGDLIGVCLGAGSKAAADSALEYGFKEVYYSEAEIFEKPLAGVYAQACKALCGDCGADVVVGCASSLVKDFFPQLALLLEAGQASEVVAVNEDGSLRRPMYAGNVLADVEILTEARAVTIRGTAFEPAEPGVRGGEVRELGVELAESAAQVVGYEFPELERPELADAAVVVSGGRGLQSAEKFEELLFPLADSLEAGIGASRAAVDAGFVPNDWQVGQTGKVVAPDLYIAVGISGAIQHLAGMKDSKVIVAINKDPDAPIFEVADYGLVADLFQAVPELVEEIMKTKTA